MLDLPKTLRAQQKVMSLDTHKPHSVQICMCLIEFVCMILWPCGLTAPTHIAKVVKLAVEPIKECSRKDENMTSQIKTLLEKHFTNKNQLTPESAQIH